MVFYLKDVHVMIWCDQAPSCKFICLVMKNDKFNNWSHEIHAVIPHFNFEHINGKENIQADSLS